MANPRVETRQRITQWVRGGRYAVAVEVEAVIPDEDPSEPCLTPETVRYLEQVADWAEADNLEALQQAGTVYMLMGEQPVAR